MRSLNDDPCRGGRTLIVSNRLPITAQVSGGEVQLRRSDGGLATGLRAVHEQCEGLWIGWSGLTEEAWPIGDSAIMARLHQLGAAPISLRDEEVKGYYRGYCNGTLWPVLHGWPARSAAVPRDWEFYQAVNQHYADCIGQHLRPGDRVWIHDFHLLLLPRLLRERFPEASIGFFFHTPFPVAQSFAALGEARALMEGVLGANQIGFHTRNDERHFTAAVQLLLGRSLAGHGTRGDSEEPRVFTCPMGIDVGFFTSWARKPAVVKEAARIREECDGPLFVGVDRLDYTKGIAERLLAFERLLELEPSLQGHARLIQIAVPSREDCSGYSEYRRKVEQLVARINRRFGNGRLPIEYRYARVDTETLVTLYRAADVMLVTPLCDGLNLVAKEFVACREDEGGVLVLSSRAGAASELYAAVLTNSVDPEDLVRAYRTGLAMSAAEQRCRMRHMRLRVQTHDVFRWSDRCLETLNGIKDYSISKRAGGIELCEFSSSPMYTAI